MKIAAISEDGVTISQYFGRAPLYVVITVEDNKAVNKETREKAGHHTFAAHHAEVQPGERHGYDAGAQVRHANMVSAISDCQVVLAGGMGGRARELLASSGITVVVGIESSDAKATVQAYLNGTLAGGDNACDHSGCAH